MLMIKTIRLRNYRTFDDCTLGLHQRTVVLGANNVGKTSLLEAIESILGAGRRGYGFTEDDIRRGSPPGTKILVDLTIRSNTGDRLDADQHAAFGTHVDVHDGDQEQVLLRVEAGPDEIDGIFRTRARLVKSDGLDDGPLGVEHRQALAMLLFQASRDARRELSDRFGLWARVTGTLSLSVEQLERLRKLGEETGDALVGELLGSDSGADQLAGEVSSLLGDVLYGGASDAELSFSATPLDARQILRQIEVRLRIPGDSEARPLVEHSVGTQSVVLFGLFHAYLRALSYNLLAVAVEEPEVHLFPHAARSLAKGIRALDVQTIVTTHSTSVTDLADPRDLLVLRRHGDRTVACAVPDGYLSDSDAKGICRRMQAVGSGFAFARAVLFVEGQSEELALPILAEQLGLDFDSLGVSLVAVDGSSFRAFAKLLHPDALNIPHLMVCDNDQAVRQLMRDLDSAGALPPGVNSDDPQAGRPVLEAAGYYWWSAGDFEACLLAAGAGSLFKQAITELYGARRFSLYEQRVRIERGSVPINESELIRGFVRQNNISKPGVAQRVAELFGESGHTPPDEVRRLLERLAQVAREQMETGGDADPPTEP
jgi:putative ATP-dependent endonuclease of the OLD family